MCALNTKTITIIHSCACFCVYTCGDILIRVHRFCPINILHRGVSEFDVSVVIYFCVHVTMNVSLYHQQRAIHVKYSAI